MTNQSEDVKSFESIARTLERFQIDDCDWLEGKLQGVTYEVSFHPTVNQLIAERSRMCLVTAQNLMRGYYYFLRAQVDSPAKVPDRSCRDELYRYFATQCIGELGMRQDDIDFLTGLHDDRSPTPKPGVLLFLKRLGYVEANGEKFKLTFQGTRFLENR